MTITSPPASARAAVPHVRQVAETFAAELTGLVLAPPAAPESISAIVDALDRYGVVVLPGQTMTPDEQIVFSEQLGPLENSDEGNPKYKEFRDKLKFSDSRVSEISNLVDGETLLDADDQRRFFQFANQIWHADSTFRPIRARYTMLLAVKVPDSGGDTEFADMAGAYDALPDALKAEIDGLIGIHSPLTVMDLLGATKPDGSGFTSTLGTQRRPIVDVHAGSGRKVLCIPSHCSHIEGMSLPEGRALLTHLREVATQPRFVYRHRWTPGELVIWDNRSTLHRACRFKEREEPRQLVRTLVQDA